MARFPFWRRRPAKVRTRPVKTALLLERLEDRTLLSGNPIVAENQLAGTPQSVWDIPSGDAGDPTIQGFATAISVNHGQTVSFKVNDTQNAPYRLDIYRMGYYQGNGARLVASIGSAQTVRKVQPSPLTDSTTGLIDCGNWSVTASWAVPAAAVSGIYFADVIRTDTGGMSQIFFVVRDDNDPTPSDLLLKTADSSWVAYNAYGGNSLYDGQPRQGGPYGGAYAVSYNRPFDTRSNASQSFVYNAEYPMVRWLEANGYNVSYTTDVDTAQSSAQLTQHKVLLSVGHDEYWSAPERNNVQAARAAGVNLAFFSGNEVFWETRWQPSIDSSATPYRTVVCYKETFNPPLDPQDPPQWTGTWRDPNSPSGPQPENALTGTLFMVNGAGPGNVRDDAITVPAAYAGLRFWRNTAVAALQPGQSYTTPTGVLGYEWDVMPDNGFEPVGAFALSSTTLDVSGYYLEDYGGTFGAGTATHSLVLYRDPTSHALVFGAGTVQWAWALDANHDRGSGGDVTDVNLQQATVNLFADMGAQPGSLQPGLVAAAASTDPTPPTSTITGPANGAVLNAGSPVTITGTATDSGGGVVAGVQVSLDGGTSWHPAAMGAAGKTISWSFTWTPASGGSVTIKSRAVDDSGNLEAPSAGIAVTMISKGNTLWSASAAPSVASAADASAVEVGVKFTADAAGNVLGVRFYKGAQNTGTHVGHLWTASGQLLASVTFSGETASGWQQANFSSPVAIQANTVYVISYSAPGGHYAQDQGYFGGPFDNAPLHAPATGAVAGGNGVYAYGASGTFPNQSSNGTNYWVDVVFDGPPMVTAVSPAAGAGGVSTTAAVTVFFNKALNASTVTSQTVYLKDPTGAAVPAAVSYNATTYTATLTPSAALAAAVTYTLTVLGGSGGVKDTAGNAMAAGYASSFTTDGPAAVVTATSPAAGAAGVGTTAAVSATFSHAMSAASLTAATFLLKDAAGNAVPAAVSYNAGTLTATLVPKVYLATSASYTATLVGGAGGVQDVNGKPLAASYSWSFATAAVASPAPSLWPPGAAPAAASVSDASPVELGVKFRSDSSGYVTAIRFYKGAQNTGTHVGHLWTASGQLLASVTFSGETASGWQQANFSSPVALTAGAIYVASYFAPAGGYAEDPNYFATAGVDASPLHAPASGAVAGGNGVYLYATSGGFPTQTYNGSNYWVDVAFAVAPTVTATSPAAGATAVSTAASVTATFSEAMDPTTLTAGTVLLKDGSGNAVAASVGYNASTFTATLTPGSALAPDATYTLTVLGGSGGVKDTAGNAMAAGYASSFTTDGPAPVISAASPAGGTTGISTTAPVSVTFSHAMDPTTVTAAAFLLKDGSGNAVPAAISYDGTSNTVTLTPDGFFATSASYTVTVVGGAGGVKDVNGHPLASTSSWSFTTAAQAAFYPSLWRPTVTPSVASAGDTSAVELGVKFSSAVSGTVTGIRFYKGAQNTGTHVGHLWTASGQLLASVTFTGETASGWQQANFSSPVAIQANTVYVASYFAPNGGYAKDDGYFLGTGVNASPLHAPASGAVAGGNGVYLYAGSGGFPSNTYNGANYWVDVVFADSPTVTAVSPAAGATGVSTLAAIAVVFDRAMDPTSLTSATFFLKDSSGNLVAATISYDPATNTAKLIPNAPLKPNTTYTVTLAGGGSGSRVKDLYGDFLAANFSWSFTTGNS